MVRKPDRNQNKSQTTSACVVYRNPKSSNGRTNSAQIIVISCSYLTLHRVEFLSNKMSSCLTAIVLRSAALTATSTRNLATTSALVARHRQIGRIKKVPKRASDTYSHVESTYNSQSLWSRRIRIHCPKSRMPRYVTICDHTHTQDVGKELQMMTRLMFMGVGERLTSLIY